MATREATREAARVNNISNRDKPNRDRSGVIAHNQNDDITKKGGDNIYHTIIALPTPEETKQSRRQCLDWGPKHTLM